MPEVPRSIRAKMRQVKNKFKPSLERNLYILFFKETKQVKATIDSAKAFTKYQATLSARRSRRSGLESLQEGVGQKLHQIGEQLSDDDDRDVVIKKNKNKSSLPSIEQNFRSHEDFEINENGNRYDEYQLKPKRRIKKNPDREQINEFEERYSFGSDNMLYPNLKKYDEDHENFNSKLLSRKIKKGSKKHLRLKLKLNKSRGEDFDDQDC